MPSGEAESEINLLDVLIALGQEKLTVIVVTALAAMAGVVISLTTPPTYMARTSINLVGNCLATVVMARWEGEFQQDNISPSPSAESLTPSH